MSEEIIIRNCSPTLAGLKTGNLFSYRFESKEKLLNEIRMLNRKLTSKGLRIVPLRIQKDKALIYVFRPSKLKKDLSSVEAALLLSNHGYTLERPDECIVQLINRIQESEDFPHEIGLFLGYPPEDVLGFIEKNVEPKCSGYWKVYGDADKAKKLFAQYKKCTDIYMSQLIKGKSIERLTVAV